MKAKRKNRHRHRRALNRLARLLHTKQFGPRFSNRRRGRDAHVAVTNALKTLKRKGITETLQF